ncbi:MULTISPECIES: hypothetical protein [Rhizobium/Agrobacterium group]|uniref:hypothetical protein n=1 Tax=Rhizobium/Agrobacterium group TaxID=227290 RepID=UPI001FCD6ED3|nr:MULTISPECIES: hypothetical protein [Rhizobium/Agrobacterium group]
MLLAQKYIWWKSPSDAADQPERVIAQVMNIGDFEDIQRLEALAGNDMLVEVLNRAEIGQFTPRSWTYWHYRLGIADIDQVPPLPSRRFV